MNSIVKVFGNSEIRFVSDPQGKWDFGIVADDIAAVLESSSGKDLARSVDDEWKGAHNVPTLGGIQSVTVIWEPGVYECLAKSRKPQAAPFKKWLFEEVLVSIRKTGSYSISQDALDRPSRALVASREIKEIYDNVDLISPRLAQFLTDCCLNEVVNKSLPSGERLRGVVEIAQEMKLPVNEKNRSALGKFVKAGLSHLAQSEERLCNGTLQPIALYPDTPEVRERISLYFNS